MRMPALGPEASVRIDVWALALTAAFGVALAVVAWAPFAVIERYLAPSRATYVPFAGVLFVLAAALDGAAAIGRRGRALGAVGRGAVVFGLLWAIGAGSVMMVGVQSLLRERWRMDLAQARELARLVPDPVQGTAFLPLALWDLPARTGSWRFDSAAIGAFRLGWAATPLVQWEYGRDDVTAGGCYVIEGRAREVLDAEGSTLVYTHRLGPSSTHVSPGRYLAPWSIVVPFVVDRGGGVRLVSRIVIRRDGAEDEIAEPGQVAALVRVGAVPARDFVLVLP
jgi:hypothetical protein